MLSIMTAASLQSAVQAAEEAHEKVIEPWIVGVIALGILLTLLIVLVSFGGGREHS